MAMKRSKIVDCRTSMLVPRLDHSWRADERRETTHHPVLRDFGCASHRRFMIIDACTASSPPIQQRPKIDHHHTGIVFTFRWNPRSRCAGNREHHAPQYAHASRKYPECPTSLSGLNSSLSPSSHARWQHEPTLSSWKTLNTLP